ncbi:MFS transporter [Pseudonocardia acidicola]|uniref:MHS family MFS transporter n=1 Tax=Pseudonocardia acidicola TaxID=2724939 RepID=A0ABX1SGQ4_9PSEU|nr:MFS transporter [Pseudonocardia acidicola]NMI00749.1 MHS family MFS transporter [Pseudonocardia acidicola]
MITAGSASTVGFAFDLFDLFILLYVASTIGPLFFPAESATLQLAATYASFGVSLVMRPLGGAVFGRYADRLGRRRSMIVTITGVGLATALMGALPTHDTIGMLAPVLFVALRLVQGLLVGGVVASTHTLGTETVPQRWRGLVSGLISGGGAGLGAVIASLVFLAVSAAFPGPAFTEWGWRVMFFAGLLASAFSLVLFRFIEESPLWAAAAHKATPQQAARARDLWAPGRRVVLLTSLGLVVGAGAQYYLTSGFLPTFLGSVNEVPAGSRGLLLVWMSLAILPVALLVGHLSECFGRRRVFLAVGGVNLVALPLLVAAMAGLGPTDTGPLLGYGLLLTVLANASYAAVPIYLNERFPTRLRATATAVVWNGGFALGGLSTTFVTAASPTVADIPSRLAVFLLGCVAIFLIGAALSPETRGALERPDADAAAQPGPEPESTTATAAQQA